mgnify:CR=1 FL=1
MVYTFDSYPVGGHFPRVDWVKRKFPATPALDPVKDGGPGWSGRAGGVRVDGSALPKRVTWKEPVDNPPPDVDDSPTLNLSEAAMRVVEALEPGTHQFFPVDYAGRGGRSLGRRYWFVICNRIASVHPQLSNMVMSPIGLWQPPEDAVRQGWELPPHVDPAAPPRFVIDLATVGCAQLWVDKHSGMRLMSHTARNAFDEAGLTGLRSRRLDVVPAIGPDREGAC